MNRSVDYLQRTPPYDPSSGPPTGPPSGNPLGESPGDTLLDSHHGVSPVCPLQRNTPLGSSMEPLSGDSLQGIPSRNTSGDHPRCPPSGDHMQGPHKGSTTVTHPGDKWDSLDGTPCKGPHSFDPIQRTPPSKPSRGPLNGTQSWGPAQRTKISGPLQRTPPRDPRK